MEDSHSYKKLTKNNDLKHTVRQLVISGSGHPSINFPYPFFSDNNAFYWNFDEYSKSDKKSSGSTLPKNLVVQNTDYE